MQSNRPSQPKIALIGAGQIGGNLALLAAQRRLGHIHLIDVAEGLAKGKALDISQAGATEGYVHSITGSSDFQNLKGADVAIVTAGLARKPGMGRDDLLDTNVKIMADVGRHIKNHCQDAFVIVVSNPLDAMVYTLAKIAELPKHKVVGMAGVLDSSRFRSFVAERLKVAMEDVSALVLGGHGDDMVPLVSHCAVGGVPLQSLLPAAEIEGIVQRTRQGGGEIVGLLKTGSAYYAPAASAILMAESYLRDAKRVLPAAAWCSGEYGLRDLFVGVPVVIGSGGVEKILTVALSEAENKALKLSAAHVAELVEEANKRL